MVTHCRGSRWGMCCALLALAGGVARAENYAVLFSGGVDKDHNYYRYYNEMIRMYSVVIEGWHFEPRNVVVLAADGLDPGNDRVAEAYGGGKIYANSDWGLIQSCGSQVLEATHDNVRDAIQGLQTGPEDLFYFWSFDHGSGEDGNTTQTEEETLCAWRASGSGDIADNELAAWVGGLDAHRQAYVFCECFSGGMLDELGIAPGQWRFGCAAANHYEVSITTILMEGYEGFVTFFTDGSVEHGLTTTGQLYQYAYQNDPHATDGQGPGGRRQDGVTHPWAVGDNLDLCIARWVGDGVPSGAGNTSWSDPANWYHGHVPSGTGTTHLKLYETGQAIISDGPHVVGALVVDYDARGVSGGLCIQAGAGLHCAYQTAGREQGGRIQQTGGVNEVELELTLGRWAGAAGDYQMRGGELRVAETFLVGDGGEGSVFQDNGAVTARQIVVGNRGSGEYQQFGGSVSAPAGKTLEVWIGKAIGGTGRYTLGGTGTLTTEKTIVAGAEASDGNFVQLDGDHVVAGMLGLGLGPGAAGRYDLGGGSLETGAARIGELGTGTFRQTGGSHGVGGDVELGCAAGSYGSYEITDGSLVASSGTIHVGVDGVGAFHLKGGIVVADKLQLGADPACTFTTDDSNAIGTLRVNQLAGLGDDVDFNGTLDLGHAGGSGAGSWDLPNFQAALDVSNRLCVGYNAPATFTQDGWQTTVTLGNNLRLGSSTGGNGTYELSGIGATLNVPTEYIGRYGSGTFNQTDGSNILSHHLYVGYGANSGGQYNLSGGVLTADNIYVGYEGAGAFSQSGSSEVTATGTLYVAKESGSSGTYQMLGNADVSAGTMFVGDDGDAHFQQIHGTVTVTGNLYIGYGAGTGAAPAMYVMNNGTLAADEMQIGTNGTGEFRPGGGDVTIAGTLYVGKGPMGEGTVALSGGTLSADTAIVGDSGCGFFTQGGASTFLVDGWLTVGETYGRDSVYNLESGTLDVGQLGVDTAGTFNWTGGTLTAGQVTLGGSGVMHVEQDASFDTYLTFHGGTLDAQGHTVALDTDPETSSSYMNGGRLLAGSLVIGNQNTGWFSELAGRVAVDDTLTVGAGSGSWGRFNQTDGTLTGRNAVIGGQGEGQFDQDSGRATFSGTFVAGEQADGNGTVDVGEEFSARYLYVGKAGKGTLTQYGSASRVSVTVALGIGRDPGGVGTYNLDWGHLDGGDVYVGQEGTGTFVLGEYGSAKVDSLVIGDAGTVRIDGSRALITGVLERKPAGTFEQTQPALLGFNRLRGFGDHFSLDGSVTIGHDVGSGVGAHTVGAGQSLAVTGDLKIGNSAAGTVIQEGADSQVTAGNTVGIGGTRGEGTYELRGGSLSATGVVVGLHGNGRMIQTGGQVNVSGALVLGQQPDARGTYRLDAGTILAPNQVLGFTGRAEFNQNGGVNTADGMLAVGYFPGSDGTYNLNGGDLVAGQAVLGYAGTGRLVLNGGSASVNGSVQVGTDLGRGELALIGTGLTLAGDLKVQTTTGDTGGAGILRCAPTGTAAGQDYGQVVHAPAGSDSAALGGTLVMDFTDYTPSAGDSFDLVTGFGEVYGEFDSVSLVGVSADAFDYALSYDGGTVTFTTETGASSGQCTATVLRVRPSGVCRAVPRAGSLGVAFAQTAGGELRYTYEHEAKDGLTVPPIDGTFLLVGADRAQSWKAAYDGTYTGEIELTFTYDQKLLAPDEDERLVAVWHHDGRDWEELVPLEHNTAADYVTVLARGFSPFVLGYRSRLPGDCDEDRDVDMFDYLVLKQNLGTTRGAQWPDGDFTDDGAVDENDLAALEYFFGLQLPTPGRGALTPEPATGLLLGLAGAVLFRRHSRRGSTFRRWRTK